jgi:hypothetical protein
MRTEERNSMTLFTTTLIPGDMLKRRVSDFLIDLHTAATPPVPSSTIARQATPVNGTLKRSQIYGLLAAP